MSTCPKCNKRMVVRAVRHRAHKVPKKVLHFNSVMLVGTGIILIASAVNEGLHGLTAVLVIETLHTGGWVFSEFASILEEL